MVWNVGVMAFVVFFNYGIEVIFFHCRITAMAIFTTGQNFKMKLLGVGLGIIIIGMAIGAAKGPVVRLIIRSRVDYKALEHFPPPGLIQICIVLLEVLAGMTLEAFCIVFLIKIFPLLNRYVLCKNKADPSRKKDQHHNVS